RTLSGFNNWSQIFTTGANVTAHTDSGLQAATAYDYRLHSTNGDGDSSTVSIFNIATPMATPTPSPTPQPSPSPTPSPSPSPTPLGSFDVFWTDLTNTSASGSSLEKSGTAELEDARGRSLNLIFGGNGFVEFQFPIQGQAAVGLNTGAQAMVRSD